MEIKIKVADDSVQNLTQPAYDAYIAELTARVKEVYPSSNLLITHDVGPTIFTTHGFHDDDEARIVLHEILEDVHQHGHWLKNKLKHNFFIVI